MAQADTPQTRHWEFSTDFEGIGWLTLDVKDNSVNVLSREVIAELETLVGHFENLGRAGELAGVVLLSGKSGFIAGADISEFDQMSDPAVLPEALKRTHALFQRIEDLKFPFVCGISGFCVGGGLELALACHYRIAVNDDATRLGFPEVNLGIFPGFAGTGRSIRQAGPVDAMQLMLTGKIVRAKQARALNLVDKLVRHPDMLRWEGRKAVLAKRRSAPAPLAKRAMAFGPIRSRVADRMREEAGKKAPKNHYPAPYALIDLFEKYGDDPKKMIAHEIDAFVPLMASPTAQNLRRVFFLSESLKRLGVKGGDKPKFTRIHVVGAGVMGGDIAAWCAYRGFYVTLQDMDMDRIKPALDRARKLFKKRLKTKQAVDAAMARLEPDVEGKAIPRCDVLIEAVVEKLEVKQQIFAEAEKRLKPTAIMATNTSSIELERIAEALDNPNRLIGLHFFNPVAQLPLVEVIRSNLNDDEAIRLGASFVLAIGKSPVIVKSAPGFLVNRALMPYMLEAVDRVEQGESAEQLDAAAVAFGMPMGPIELMDTVGLDVGAFVARELGQKIPESSRFAKLIAAGKLGRKTGEGFYKWEDGKPLKEKPPAHGNLEGLGRDLVQPLVDTAEVIVSEGVVESADMADIGMILGTGFAPFLGGPIKARQDGRA
ncbi:3-hydroxyacyl-CoA dehydrogenase NAD-binding domain-containing protein [Pelagibacterium sp. 26DY04]|uniref:3-hydroxyacyl-CoA dehydrogenase NAD-binding domain-containing protein n=1 Tax=Pelagibacterium sp. 26DY04 TaxID=2967130 RepID=UPI002816805C|nr:3-hydroxyacyl-CoA dehydrogenase NAD-binding domain-containing protein [Pelagibacterium sp. 26DY04]WMT86359.1 3-hydroxyacyl-CoA dehydrogenase NAD-binding domain-containing protein [Pelagibacterium sp. 26DY04]